MNENKNDKDRGIRCAGWDINFEGGITKISSSNLNVSHHALQLDDCNNGGRPTCDANLNEIIHIAVKNSDVKSIEFLINLKCQVKNIIS